MKTAAAVLFCLVLLFGPVPSARAEYVLPYPSVMPGSKLYRIARITDSLKRYFHFGPIGSHKYYLTLSDKYLVEAKTLFEYKQYLLAVDALTRSDEAFAKAGPFIGEAKKRGVDTETLKTRYSEAAIVHIAKLTAITDAIPETFVWTPEKAPATTLRLHEAIRRSVAIRNL